MNQQGSKNQILVEAFLQQTQVELTKEVVSEVGRSKPAPSRKEATHGGERATERKRPRERERERERDGEGKAQTESRCYEGRKGSTRWWRKQGAKPRGREGGMVGERESEK